MHFYCREARRLRDVHCSSRCGLDGPRPSRSDGSHRNMINNIEVFATGGSEDARAHRKTLRGRVEFIDENGGGPGVRLRKHFKSKR